MTIKPFSGDKSDCISYNKIYKNNNSNHTSNDNFYNDNWDKAALPKDFNQIEISEFELDMNMYRENTISQISKAENIFIIQNSNNKQKCDSISTPEDIHPKKICKSKFSNHNNYDPNPYKYETSCNQKKLYDTKSIFTQLSKSINNKYLVYFIFYNLFSRLIKFIFYLKINILLYIDPEQLKNKKDKKKINRFRLDNESFNKFEPIKNDSSSTSRQLMLDELERSQAMDQIYIENKKLEKESFREFFKGKKEGITQLQKKMIISISNRTFVFPIRDSSCISCFKISITEISKINDFLLKFKSSLKIAIVFALYLFLWFYIAIFVQSIYKQYGNNIFKICVMPLISMLFIKLVFVVNLMFFLTNLVLYYKGNTFVNNSKKTPFSKIIFAALVPPPALNHYVAINYFIKILDMIK